MEYKYRHIKTFPIRSFVLPLSDVFLKIDLTVFAGTPNLGFRLVWGESSERAEFFFHPIDFYLLKESVSSLDFHFQDVDAFEFFVKDILDQEIKIEVLKTDEGLKVDLGGEYPFLMRSKEVTLLFSNLLQRAYSSFLKNCNFFELGEYTAQPAYGGILVYSDESEALLAPDYIMEIYSAVKDLDKKLTKGEDEIEYLNSSIALKGELLAIDCLSFILTIDYQLALLFSDWAFFKIIFEDDPNFQYWRKSSSK